MVHFKDPEAGETDQNGAKLKRPWTVFVLAFLIALAVVTVAYTRGAGNGRNDRDVGYGLAGFAALAMVLSAIYSFIGARYSLALARRIVGIIGSALIATGIGLNGIKLDLSVLVLQGFL